MEDALRRAALAARRWLGRGAGWLAKHGMSAYVAGDALEDALALGERLQARGLGISVGYWDGPQDSPQQIAAEYRAGIEALAGRERAYLSIKPPSLGGSPEHMAELLELAARHRVRLHFDALAPETVEGARALFEECLGRGATLSWTLPGRWARSVQDARWISERGIEVRVVKGQWPDPVGHPGSGAREGLEAGAAPNHAGAEDLRAGFLRVIDALAGRARRVAVASHDLPLVQEAVQRLERAGTPHLLELLHGLPMRPLLALARERGLDVNVYVPYGQAFLPYALSGALRNPRMLAWIARDVALGARAALLERLRGPSARGRRALPQLERNR